MRRLFALVLGTSHLLAASAEDVTCYKPDRTSKTFNGTMLCSDVDGAVSMCCGWNDVCLDNGLCKVKGTPSGYWRDMCSISSWPDVGCLNVCTDDGDIDDAGNAPMTPCDGTDYSETWCCGQTTDCCGTDEEVTIPTNIYVSTSTPNSTSTSTSASLTSTQATTSSSSTTTPSSEQSQTSSGLSSGSKAGIGVGVAAGVIVVVGFFSFLVMRRRRKRAVIASGTRLDGSAQPGAGPDVPQELEPTPVYEKPADKQNTRYELPAEPFTIADR